MKLNGMNNTTQLLSMLNEVSQDLLETSSWKATQRIELELKQMSLINELSYIQNK